MNVMIFQKVAGLVAVIIQTVEADVWINPKSPEKYLLPKPSKKKEKPAIPVCVVCQDPPSR